MPSIVTITPPDSARNLGVIFDSSFTMSEHNSSVSKSCFMSIRDLHRIRNTLVFTTAKTLATSLIHSKVDYWHSLFLNLPRSQLDRLQLILNAGALAFSKTHLFNQISPVLKFLHYLEMYQYIHYIIISITYKTLQSRRASYLRNLLHIQSNTCTRSFTTVTLKRPSVSFQLKITNRSFTHHAPVHWNALPKEFRQPAIHSSHAS